MVAQTIVTLALIGAAVAAPQGGWGGQNGGQQWGPGAHSESAGAWGDHTQAWGGADQSTQAWGSNAAQSWGAASIATTETQAWPTMATSWADHGSWSSAAASQPTTWEQSSSQWTSSAAPTTWTTPVAPTTYVPPPPATWTSAPPPPATSTYVPPPPATTPPPYPVTTATSSYAMPTGSGVPVSSYSAPQQTGAAAMATPLAGLLAGAFAVAMF